MLPGARRRLSFWGGWLLLVAPGLPGQLTPGSITSIAGTGANGYSGDGGAATSAQMEVAYDTAADAWGNVYLADSWNHRIRKISPDGTIGVFAGNGTPGFSGDGGAAVSASLNFPRGLAVDAWGNVFVSDSGNGVIRKIQTDGVIRTFAGNGKTGDQGDGGPAIQASLRVPRGLAVDARGNLYIADSFNFRVRKVTPDGKISTVAGNGRLGNFGDGGPATQANLGIVHSIAADYQGNLYLSDTDYHCVRRVSSDGVIQTIAGTGQAGLAGDGGPAAAAALSFPHGLAIDQLGNLFVADSGNHRIRAVNKDGFISTVIGTGEPGFGGDQGPAAQALVDNPYGLASDPRGNVYVTDLLSYRVRKARFESLHDNPIIVSQSVVDGASFRHQISPGGLISVFGANFGYQPLPSLDVPLPPSIGGTSLIINGKPAPLIFVSPGQLNAQLPWEAPSSIDLKVNFGGLESDTIAVPVSASTPAIFLWGDGRAVAQNQDYTLNTAANRAPRGSVIMVYATGLGPVSPRLDDGAAAPLSPLTQTSGITSAWVGGVSAKVWFSGMTSGFVGLWQVNVEIPLGSPAGDVPVKISVDGSDSNEGMISVP
jgi:uncharacterized protein (TIGR03437 family)